MRYARGMQAAVVLILFAGSRERALALNPSLDVSQHAHNSWKIRDGFVRGRIQFMAQTPDGYLWLGTEFGLVRLDGVRAVPWTPPVTSGFPASGSSG